MTPEELLTQALHQHATAVQPAPIDPAALEVRLTRADQAMRIGRITRFGLAGGAVVVVLVAGLLVFNARRGGVPESVTAASAAGTTTHKTTKNGHPIVIDEHGNEVEGPILLPGGGTIPAGDPTSIPDGSTTTPTGSNGSPGGASTTLAGGGETPGGAPGEQPGGQPGGGTPGGGGATPTTANGGGGGGGGGSPTTTGATTPTTTPPTNPTNPTNPTTTTATAPPTLGPPPIAPCSAALSPPGSSTSLLSPSLTIPVTAQGRAGSGATISISHPGMRPFARAKADTDGNWSTPVTLTHVGYGTTTLNVNCSTGGSTMVTYTLTFRRLTL